MRDLILQEAPPHQYGTLVSILNPLVAWATMPKPHEKTELVIVQLLAWWGGGMSAPLQLGLPVRTRCPL